MSGNGPGSPSIDVEALARWMDQQHVVGTGELPALSQLTGGSQNELFLVERGDSKMVLRRPPAAKGSGRSAAFARELTLLRALKGTDVPHAELLAGTESSDVLGVPFYVMTFVDGWSPTSTTRWPSPYDADPTTRPALGRELVAGAANLASVDWRARGLVDFGRPDGFHDRQVDRWLRFLSGYEFRDLPGLAETSHWLRGHGPPRSWQPGIMHGDYQFANVIFSHDAPRLAAIVDWEMTTIGDPLLDLAWALIAWPPEGDDMEKARYVDLDGMPPLDEMLEHYESITGRSTEGFGYYLVLARWKLAIVLEMTYARHVADCTDDAMAASFGPLVLELMRMAHELSRTVA